MYAVCIIGTVCVLEIAVELLERGTYKDNGKN